jgi:hypothetical protein
MSYYKYPYQIFIVWETFTEEMKHWLNINVGPQELYWCAWPGFLPGNGKFISASVIEVGFMREKDASHFVLRWM